MGDKRMLERMAKETPILEDFHKKYCVNCGTQRCLGVFDELWRDGCEIWQKSSQKSKIEETKKTIIAIVGPSGSGKTTLSLYLYGRYGIPFVCSYTT